MQNQYELKFNDGHTMPQLGFGLWQVPNTQAADVVAQAIRAGYRIIDSAAAYGNEEGVGMAFKASRLARDELFVTTKPRIRTTAMTKPCGRSTRACLSSA